MAVFAASPMTRQPLPQNRSLRTTGSRITSTFCFTASRWPTTNTTASSSTFAAAVDRCVRHSPPLFAFVGTHALDARKVCVNADLSTRQGFVALARSLARSPVVRLLHSLTPPLLQRGDCSRRPARCAAHTRAKVRALARRHYDRVEGDACLIWFVACHLDLRSLFETKRNRHNNRRRWPTNVVARFCCFSVQSGDFCNACSLSNKKSFERNWKTKHGKQT